MCQKSPAKILRNVKRITKFFSKKCSNKVQNLSVVKIQFIDIPPTPRPNPNLSKVHVQTTNVPASPTPALSIFKNISIDIPPSAQNYLPNVTKPDFKPQTENRLSHMAKFRAQERRQDLEDFEVKLRQDLAKMKFKLGLPPE